MKKYRVICFSRQEFGYRDIIVEAESAKQAANLDNIILYLTDEAWYEWGKDDGISYSECMALVQELEIYVVCAVEESVEFAWCLNHRAI